MAKRTPSELNLLLAVDKPVGVTSHDVVAAVRRSVGERRVGHAGTLDPLASGVMIVGIGQATRLLGRITLDHKGYIARIAFGAETTTEDAEGEVTRTMPLVDDLYSPLFAREVLSSFVGEQEQVPPAYSAISVDGVRAYARARAGEEVELPARTIEVFGAQLISIDEVDGAPVWTVSFDVSKGTYIRSLARDIGRAAGNAAHIADLRRTASGCVTLGTCVRVDDLDADVARTRALDPVRVLGVPAASISDTELTAVLNGQSLALDARRIDAAEAAGPREADDTVALVHDGQLRALARPMAGRLRMETVFPQGIDGASSVAGVCPDAAGAGSAR